MRLATLAVLIFTLAGALRGEDVDVYLIPVAPQLQAGAYGSLWTNEFTVHNAATTPFVIRTTTCSPVIVSCLAHDVLLQPGQTLTPTVYRDAGALEAGWIQVQRPHAGLAMQLRIRDLSRQAEEWGTELPLINLESFRSSIQLLDVPTDPRFRVTLRVYSTKATSAQVRLLTAGSTTPLSEQTVNLIGDFPTEAQVPLPANLAATNLRIEIAGLGSELLWAFASITSNITQHVTTITPQP
jgi:hypothetical protein